MQGGYNYEEQCIYRSKPSYPQHSTVGILYGSNLPNPVIQPRFAHKKLLAEEFLDVSLLTNIQAELVNDNRDQIPAKAVKGQ